MAKKGHRRRSKRRSGRRDPLARERALDALSYMRSGKLSLAQAARRAHTKPETVRKYVGRAVVRGSNGRYRPTPSDRLTRYVWILTKDGKREVAVRGSRPAERVARHMAAVDRYLRTGDADLLAIFDGKGLRSRNEFHPFLTDTDALERLAQAGEVSFERLYSRRA